MNQRHLGRRIKASLYTTHRTIRSSDSTALGNEQSLVRLNTLFCSGATILHNKLRSIADHSVAETITLQDIYLTSSALRFTRCQYLHVWVV